MALQITINGVGREFAELAEGASLAELVAVLGLKADRVAIERNGEIAPRDRWKEVRLEPGDRLEVVHFVGGGTADCGVRSRLVPHCT